ncbi:MAG: hypothetical protein H0T62_05850 [Parachlamydiaceae bacterium]|nr:hypothetical protein [Parachlamydiaceae bacterium]
MKVIKASILLAVALALVSLQAFKDFYVQPTPSMTLLEKKIGTEVLEVLQHPASVIVFSVEPKKLPKHYTSTSAETMLPTELTTEFQKLLLNDKHFVFGMNKRSPFLPYIAFKFHNENEESILLLISSSSNQIKILVEETNYLLDYEPSRAEMNAFIKKVEELYELNLF